MKLHQLLTDIVDLHMVLGGHPNYASVSQCYDVNSTMLPWRQMGYKQPSMCLPSSIQKGAVHDIKWVGYRIGDGFWHPRDFMGRRRERDAMAMANRTEQEIAAHHNLAWGMAQYNGSIMQEYWQTWGHKVFSKHPKPGWKYSDGPKDRNLPMLAQIVQHRFTSVFGARWQAGNYAAIHLRLGDALVHHKSAMPYQERLLALSAEAAMQLGCVIGEEIVRSLCSWRSSRLFANKRVVIVTGLHVTDSQLASVSCIIIREVQRRLQHRAFRVTVRSGSPDDDFILIANAKTILSGRGGFAQLAAYVAETLHRSQLSQPPLRSNQISAGSWPPGNTSRLIANGG
eukprot:CAMPEP_0119332404 /NCGR_PEP_ID=MMETSP1333-20130426/82685_1 /TAXON_ID=418940 /ORGANISM="Scyphosphaera apsteinii, Strain RCC1455" /LENGTH=340 /DNA_ID=CAMNT_0007342221 /DNA_START=38 /DNA_END=1056 /DNA_ORIENTATION=+